MSGPDAAAPALAPALTARGAGLVGCRRCAAVWPDGQAECGRCGQPLRSRDTLSLQKVWAWWIAGVICYVPANMFPMLSTRMLFETHEATIVEGAIELAQAGAWVVAIIILVASVGIPVAKFAAIGWLAHAAGRGRPLGHRAMHRRLHVYEVVEFIGRWSMIDIFVVAITSALVQIGFLVYVRPGPAAIAFALSVIFTMLSARAFDSRLIWDPVPAAPSGAPEVEPGGAPAGGPDEAVDAAAGGLSGDVRGAA